MTSHLEDALKSQLNILRVPTPVSEYRWAAELLGPGKGLRDRLARAGLKDWRFDFAWPLHNLAVEVEGGAWVGGRHTRGTGFSADLEKYHSAMAHGWTIYRCDSRLIKSGQAAELIQKLLSEMAQKTPGVF